MTDAAQAVFIYRKTDLLLEQSTRAIILIKERKTALISAAVTGKIDVRDVDSQ